MIASISKTKSLFRYLNFGLDTLTDTTDTAQETGSARATTSSDSALQSAKSTRYFRTKQKWDLSLIVALKKLYRLGL